ncbi:MAG: FtsW/RodA/SpoVE family cell cycle protein [Bacteroidota bacterium]
MTELPNFKTVDLRDQTRGDKAIWSIVIILSLVSLLAVYSATNSLAYKMYKGNTLIYLFRQILTITGGVLIVYAAHRVNYTFYARVAKILFYFSIPLLIYTLKFGTSLNDANRWIKLPVINLTFQTSDLAKLALFMFLSHTLSKRQAVVKDFKKGFIPLITPVVIICVLIAPANLSTALLTGATSMLLLFIGRANIRHLLILGSFVIVPVITLIFIARAYYDKEQSKSKPLPAILEIARVPTWIKRVQDFMYAGKEEVPYQVQQAKIAVAKGGFVGLGPGNSEQRNFLPHPYSDFIYAIIIEEYGLMGGAFVIFVYLIFLFRSIKIFRRCPYAFGAFLAIGLSFTLVIQAMTNMAVNVGLFPVTGVTLPLVSMGGSSIIFTSLSIGIILSVARNVEETEGKAKSTAEVSA